MKRTLLSLATVSVIMLSASSFSGCASRSDTGLVAGGIIGGAAGSALTRGSAVGTVGGAVGGALIGRQVARRNY
jgi:osmotically inducible lipoprotein OsmB